MFASCVTVKVLQSHDKYSTFQSNQGQVMKLHIVTHYYCFPFAVFLSDGLCAITPLLQDTQFTNCTIAFKSTVISINLSRSLVLFQAKLPFSLDLMLVIKPVIWGDPEFKAVPTRLHPHFNDKRSNNVFVPYCLWIGSRDCLYDSSPPVDPEPHAVPGFWLELRPGLGNGASSGADIPPSLPLTLSFLHIYTFFLLSVMGYWHTHTGIPLTPKLPLISVPLCLFNSRGEVSSQQEDWITLCMNDFVCLLLWGGCREREREEKKRVKTTEGKNERMVFSPLDFTATGNIHPH